MCLISLWFDMSKCDRLIALSLILGCSCIYSLAIIIPIQAQIIPDSSLGDESSIVNSNQIIKNTPADLIEGGAIRDRNLFHSFDQFNVDNGNAVYFAAPENINNILTRVTGNNISAILGKLGVLEDTTTHINGTANLFLLNPNGIVFGKDAVLDISGSFLATTAQSYIFQNNFAYSAAEPSLPPLLTVNLPIGLQFGTNTGEIINRSLFTHANSFIQGLSVPAEQSLSLIGGKVVLEGGYLSTSEGNIDIGSVAPQNIVKLISSHRGWTIDYEEVATFEDISINNAGKIDGGVMGNSNIALTGKNISLGYDLKRIAETDTKLDDFFTLAPLAHIDRLPEDSVQIIANNTDNIVPPKISINAQETFSIVRGMNLTNQTLGIADAGTIDVDADTVVIYSGGFEGNTLPNSSGNGGLVTFNANRMSVQNGGGGVNTLGSGNGGTINLNIANDLKIKAGGFGADTFDTGHGGRIEINAGNLEVVEGGAGVNTLGSGNGGTIDLNVTNELKIRYGGFGADAVNTGNGGKIEIDAKTIDLKFAGIGVNARNIGRAGQIIINAETILSEDANFSSQSGAPEDLTEIDSTDFDRNQLQKRFGQQDAGDGGIISVTADSLFLGRGGGIKTNTFGAGDAGRIDLKVGYLQLEGNTQTTINSSTQASGNGGNIKIVSNEISIAEGASITADSQETGHAGDININASNIVQLQNRGKISVNGGLEGRSGNINLNANQVYLLDKSVISAKVELGNEGNIFLTANNLFLDDQSEITTDARNDSRGGNISVDLSDNLVALSNSKIVSNAVEGQGGNIQIKTRGFFLSPDSVIEASSIFGVDGTVQINTFDADYNSNLTLLPSKLIDSSLYLTQGCGLNNNHSLVNLGREGLAKSPLNTITNTILVPDIKISENDRAIASQNNQQYWHENDQPMDDYIVEAQNWQVNQQGNVELVSLAPKYNVVNQFGCASSKYK